MSKISTLIFVYNASDGLFSAIADYLHKNISPQTYECNLCAITYDNFGMKKTWKDYLKNLPVQKIFLHKQEFQKRFPNFADQSLPLILCKMDDLTSVLLTSVDLNEQKTQEDLMTKIDQKLVISKQLRF